MVRVPRVTLVAMSSASKFPNLGQREDRRRGLVRGRIAMSLTDCRIGLQAQLASKCDSGPLRAAIRDFTNAARHEELPPEQVLALFKQMVHSVTSGTHLNASERGEIMRSLTQQAIDAYYGP